MSSAITIDLSAPHARPETRRRLEVAQAPDATFQPGPVLTSRRAA